MTLLHPPSDPQSRFMPQPGPGPDRAPAGVGGQYTIERDWGAAAWASCTWPMNRASTSRGAQVLR